MNETEVNQILSPVSHRTMVRRIAYRLKQKGFVFRRVRDKASQNLGPCQVVDSAGAVVAWGEITEQAAREYGLLKQGERFE